MPAEALRHPCRASNLTGAGSLLQLIRGGRARTRADLVELTGLARSTVAQRVEALIELGLVDEAGDGASTGGRPPKALAFNPDAASSAPPTSASRTRSCGHATSPARSSAGSAPSSTSPPARRRCSEWMTSASTRCSPRRAGPRARRARGRRRRPRPGRVRHRPAGQAADHARLGRLPVPSGSPSASPARSWSTTTSTSWPSASTGSAGASAS